MDVMNIVSGPTWQSRPMSMIPLPSNEHPRLTKVRSPIRRLWLSMIWPSRMLNDAMLQAGQAVEQRPQDLGDQDRPGDRVAEDQRAGQRQVPAYALHCLGQHPAPLTHCRHST